MQAITKTVLKACRELGQDELESFSGLKQMAETYDAEERERHIREDERQKVRSSRGLVLL